jgi:hypothetical protein
MTERRGDQGFTVTPQRLGGDRGGLGGGSRRRRLGLVLVVASAAAIFTIAWLGPRLNDRPSFDTAFFATPVPSATVSPSASPTVRPIGSPTATPLPSITRPEGLARIGKVAIITDGLRVLDLATGDITAGPQTQFGRDAIFRTPGGDGWTCICFTDGFSSDGSNLTIEVVGTLPSGAPGDSTELAEMPNTIQDENGQPSVTSDIDTFDGNRHGLLALAIRKDTSWQFTVSPLDINGRKLGAPVELGKASAPVPVPSAGATAAPSPVGRIDVYVDGPHLRISPDGRVAFVWANLQRSDQEGNSVNGVHAWRIALNPDGSVDTVADAPALRDAPIFCPWIGFAAADRLAWLCPDFSFMGTGGFDGTWAFGAIDLDGRPTASTKVPLNQDHFFGPPLFDRANGQLYAWDSTGLTITRIDVHSGAVAKTTYDPLQQETVGFAPGGGSAPVDWHDADSAMKLNGYGAIAGSPEGDRLYAVAFGPQGSSDPVSQPSRGIFVIDPSTLALVDRWAPAANYFAVAALPNGLVAASGMPGVQADGSFAPWQGSITIHEAPDGQILERFGQLGEGSAPFVLDR